MSRRMGRTAEVDREIDGWKRGLWRKLWVRRCKYACSVVSNKSDGMMEHFEGDEERVKPRQRRHTHTARFQCAGTGHGLTATYGCRI